ncbi:MAG: sulfatase [Cyclobacteriaceae bacterium]|nr:sulfatase [Cyclobacteriaceae bacterium HetDA_MAG_MS6]
MKTIYLIVLALFSLLSCIDSKQREENSRQNILFIAVDDLRPELSIYGSSRAITPNFERLASKGLVFKRAYCQQAVCAPSRNSLLTGLRPDAMGIYDLGTFFRTKVPDVVTLPQHFKNNGYHSEAIGKIYHIWHGNQDDSASWSVPSWDYRTYRDQYRKLSSGDTSGIEGPEPVVKGKVLPWHSSAYPDYHHLDYGVTSRAIERMNELGDEPFFLAVGYYKPHLPFVAPQKYWDLYPKDSIRLPDKTPPDGSPDFALTSFGELRRYYGIPKEGPLTDEQSIQMIRGYLACISFIDAQLGRLLDELESSGLAASTTIVLWGDHGWKLGEYGSWCKHSNYELDTKAPLIISGPDMLAKGRSTNALTEFIDIYPSLCDITGLPKPAHLQGESFISLLDNPDLDFKEIALSQYPREKLNLMGYSIRTDRFHLISWRDNSDRFLIKANELYDHRIDPGEKRNQAGDLSYKETVEALNKRLDDDFLTTNGSLK